MKITITVMLLALFFITACQSPSGQDTGKNEKGGSSQKVTFKSVLNEFQECYSQDKKEKDCHYFTAKAMAEVYDLQEFRSTTNKSGYISITEIPSVVESHPNWHLIGYGQEPGVIDKGYYLVKEGQPVLAIGAEGDFRHVAILRKGPGAKSEKWGGYVPAAVSYFHHKPQKSFANNTLNYVFSSPQGIEIWRRMATN